jgi:hypothetical protein
MLWCFRDRNLIESHLKHHHAPNVNGTMENTKDGPSIPEADSPQESTSSASNNRSMGTPIQEALSTTSNNQSMGSITGASLLAGNGGSSISSSALDVFIPSSEPFPQSSSEPLASGTYTSHLARGPQPDNRPSETHSFIPAAVSVSAESQPQNKLAVAKSSSYNRILYVEQDEDNLSPYQVLVRKQIEIFEATEPYLREKSQGRNRPIVLNQMGIRCRHCGRLPSKERAKGAVYFPSQLDGLYQSAQNMANKHLLTDCSEIPENIREDLFRVRLKEKGSKTRKSSYGGGRHYWADSLRVLGVVQSEDRRLSLAQSGERQS